MGQHDGADIGEAQVVVLEAFVGGPYVHPQPVGTFVGRLSAGLVQQLGAQSFAAVGAVHGDLVGIQGGFSPLLLGPQLGLCPRSDGEVAVGS